MAHRQGLGRFKELCRARIREKKLTKVVVADQLHTSVNHLSRILEGSTAPNMEMGIHLARILGISPQDTFALLTEETEHDIETDLQGLLVHNEGDASWTTFWQSFKTADVSAKRALRDLLCQQGPSDYDLPDSLVTTLKKAPAQLANYWQKIFEAARLLDKENYGQERDLWVKTINTIFQGQCNGWSIHTEFGRPFAAPADFETYVQALEQALETLRPEDDAKAIFLGVSVLMPESWYNWKRKGRSDEENRSLYYERVDIRRYRQAIEKVIGKQPPDIEHKRLILRSEDPYYCGLGIDSDKPEEQQKLYFIEQLRDAKNISGRQAYDEDHFFIRRQRLGKLHSNLAEVIGLGPRPLESVYFIVNQEKLRGAGLLPPNTQECPDEVSLKEDWHAVRLVHRFKTELHSRPEYARYCTIPGNDAEFDKYIHLLGPEFDIGLLGTVQDGQPPKWRFGIAGSWSYVGNTLMMKFFTDPDALQWIGEFWHDRYEKGAVWE